MVLMINGGGIDILELDFSSEIRYYIIAFHRHFCYYFQLTIGLRAANNLASRYGTQYEVGSIAETICEYILVLEFFQ